MSEISHLGVNLKLVSISTGVRELRTFEFLPVLNVKTVDFVHEEFWHELIYQLFLNWEVILYMIVQDFKVFESVGMQGNFFEEVLANLMVLYHA